MYNYIYYPIAEKVLFLETLVKRSVNTIGTVALFLETLVKSSVNTIGTVAKCIFACRFIVPNCTYIQYLF